MTNYRSVTTLLLTACVAMMNLAASAAGVVSVTYAPAGNEMFPDEVAGAPGVRVANWNNAYTEGANSIWEFFDGEVVDQTGSPVSGLSMSLMTGNGGSTTLRGAPPGGVAPALENDGHMFRTVTDKFDGAEGTITVTGIPYSEYQLLFYVYPDAGGGGERGGYFTVTTSDGATQSRWLKGGTGSSTTIALPDPATGDGYVLSSTAVQPATYADIQEGHYVVFSGLTDPNIEVRYSAVGAGAGGVAGGDGTRRLKFSGFQIAEAVLAPVTGLTLGSPVPQLYAGNAAGYGVQALTVHSDGSTQPLGNLGSSNFTTSDPSVFTVSAEGVIQPNAPGSATLTVTYEGFTLTEAVTVIGPEQVRVSVPFEELFVGASDIQVTVVADFPDGAVDVNVTAFRGVTFEAGPAGVVEVSANGMLSAVGEGDYRVAATYNGVSGELNPAGTVLPYTPPQPADGKVAVSFNLHSGSRMLFNDLAGVEGVRVGYWNNVSGLTGSRNTVRLEAGAIKDSAGQVVGGLSAAVTGGASGAGASTRGSQTGNESTMFNGVYDQYNGVPGTIALRGIPFGTYDAYFYAFSGDADNRVGHFTIGEETRWILNSRDYPLPDNDGFGYFEAETTVQPTSVFEVVPGNYVKFSNLKGPDLDVTFVADGRDVLPDSDGAPRLKFAGFQLVGELAPGLGVTRNDAGQVRLAWPVSAEGYVLKTSAVVTGGWTTVGTAPTRVGEQWTLNVPEAGERAFYVLVKP